MMFAAARRAATRRVPALARQFAAAGGGRGAAGPGGGAGGAGWSNLTGALAAGGAVALATAFTLGGAASGVKLAEGDTTNVPSGSNPAAANDPAYYGGMALGFEISAYQNRAAVAELGQAGMEIARGAMVAAI